MTRDEILNKGFIEYPVDRRLSSSSQDENYQKCYRDEDGNKKYFMNIEHYTIIHPTTNDDIGGYEISTQLYLKNNHNAINVKFLDSDIEEAEKVINVLFESGLLENYEDKN